MSSYQYRKSHCGDKTILWLSYLHNGISSTIDEIFILNQPAGVSSASVVAVLHDYGCSHGCSRTFTKMLLPTHSNKTRRSENDNIPQPLDQWTNSSFIGQQVGNCNSFTLTHYLANLFAMHCGPRGSPVCIQHCIQLKSLIPSQLTFPFLIYGYQKFDLENPRSRSWVRSKFKSQLGSNILSTHIILVPCPPTLLFLW